MTEQEFKAEILKANPDAVFINQTFRLVCTPTKVIANILGQTVFAIEFYRRGFERPIIVDVDPSDINAGATRVSAITAIPPKKKRLMTPAECAGKWLCFLNAKYLVTNFSDDGRIGVAGDFRNVAHWHSSGFKIADTTTSYPYSLEVEE